MSADNFVGVRPNKDGTYSVFEYGSMSVYEEDCMYLSDKEGTIKIGREQAILHAHDIVNAMYICEYGVIEMPPVPDSPCRRCFVCIHERKIIAPDITLCTECNDPISDSETRVLTREGIFHSRCGRR